MFVKRPVNLVRSPIPVPQDDIPLAAPPAVLREGYSAIAASLLQLASEKGSGNLYVAFDGTHGAPFQTVLQRAVDALEQAGHSVSLIGSGSYLKSGEELREFFAANITDNRAFGYFTDGSIEDYFRDGAREEAARRLDEAEPGADSAAFCIVFGPGAYWLGEGRFDLSFYLDVSREYQQAGHRQELLSFGLNWNRDAVEKYKIALFVEWPILETYRKQILDQMDYYIDLNQPKQPVMTAVPSLRRMISDIAGSPLRVKPFYAPGVWGGQFLKQLADLPEDWVNCAWSFEPIAPENSILVEYEGKEMEIPFLLVMQQEHPAILGERLTGLFGDYFPIRFNYLDTMDGDNLSCQVHPTQDYIRSRFNEFMAQQESYYIMEQQGDSGVYLGLTEDCLPEQFRHEVQKAQETGIPLPLTDYVNRYESRKGELFLIPPGTVHSAGKDNLVLEISSTTWWFTFKIYDFLRKDLDGKPRPINIDFAFDNIDFTQKTARVEEQLMPSPVLLQQQGENEEYVLGQRSDLLFYVHRVHLKDTWKDDTRGEMTMYNLVEGESVRIVSAADEAVFVELHYAESYILPAVLGEYTIVNTGSGPCKLIKAGVSAAWDVSLLEP
ncbi:class I mannose-6-phosphate isomerase [Paenibacillus sp. FSL P2-0089]|uniref:class I mannose-6-phosphate isomerase n=1 Tax=Paenibacillus sp. FSL P2-0089 TaxID=2954526 RepID=UPI00315A93CC